MRSDGTALAVWTNSAGLRASVHTPGRPFTTRESVVEGRTGDPARRSSASARGSRGRTPSAPRSTVSANSTPETAVARFRLETPGRHRQREAGVGAGQQLVGEAVALGAEGQHRALRHRRAESGSPSGSSAISGRSPVLITRERATGSAKCSPAEPRSASACHGSWTPVVITPAAPAAAATRTHAPRLPRWRGSSSRITGAGPGQREDPVRVGLARAPRDRDAPARAAPPRPAPLRDDGRDRARCPARAARSAPPARPDRPSTRRAVRAEAHRVLDGVKALQHDEPGIAARPRDLLEPHHAPSIRPRVGRRPDTRPGPHRTWRTPRRRTPAVSGPRPACSGREVAGSPAGLPGTGGPGGELRAGRASRRRPKPRRRARRSARGGRRPRGPGGACGARSP